MHAVLLLALAALGADRRAGDEAYRRVVARALERAQEELVAGIDFEVDHSRWEDPWIVTSTHYEVRTTHSYAQATELSRALEFVHGELVKLLGPARAPSKRFPVWIFPTMADYNRFGEENGAEHSSLLGAFHSTLHSERPVASYQNGNPVLLGMWVTHAAVHQYLEHAFGPQRSVWVDEGLASYFALHWDWAYGARELERIEKARTFVPLARLPREPIQAYSDAPDDRFIELGMLFHFLLHSCEATKTDDSGSGPFLEFLRAAVRGQNVEETEFARTFAEAAELLEEDFKAFEFGR